MASPALVSLLKGACTRRSKGLWVTSITFLVLYSAMTLSWLKIIGGKFIIDESPQLSLPSNVPSKHKGAVAVIGGHGYIGSILSSALSREGFNVTIFDPYSGPTFHITSYQKTSEPPDPTTSISRHSSELSRGELQGFNTIFSLGDSTVDDLAQFLPKLSAGQHIIFVSALVESPSSLASEKDEIMKAFVTGHVNTTPAITTLQIGTVVGLAPTQGVENLFSTFLTAAYTSGVLHIKQGGAVHPYLWTQDLAPAFVAVVEKKQQQPSKYQSWSVASFHAATMKIATTTAWLTSSKISTLDVEGTNYRHNLSIFQSAFSFVPKGSVALVMEELVNNIPASLIVAGPRMSMSSVKCPSTSCSETLFQHNIVNLGTVLDPILSSADTTTMTVLRLAWCCKQVVPIYGDSTPDWGHKLLDAMGFEAPLYSGNALLMHRFAERQHFIQQWVQEMVAKFDLKGYQIVGVLGNTPEASVLLHLVCSKNCRLSRIIVGEGGKNAVFPGHQQVPTGVASTTWSPPAPPKSNYLFLVLDRDIWEKETLPVVLSLLQNQSQNTADYKVLTLYPESRLINLSIGTDNMLREEVVLEMPFFPYQTGSVLRNPDRRKSLILSHMNNEELLLPHYIAHHSSMFDRAALIDYNSTDKSRYMVQEFAPDSWMLIKSSTGGFIDAVKTDQHVMEWERKYKDDWSYCLTITEFVVQRQFRESLYKLQLDSGNATQQMYALPLLMMVGDDSQLYDPSIPLLEQRFVYAKGQGLRRARFIHYGTLQDYQYQGGRHSMIRLNDSEVITPPYWGLNGFVVKWEWTPWPEVVDRKLAVGKHIAPIDVQQGVSIQHTRRAKKGKPFLIKERNKFVQKAKNWEIHQTLQPFGEDLENSLSINYTYASAYHAAIWQPKQRTYKSRFAGSKKKKGPRGVK
jgi:hypothetical protein